MEDYTRALYDGVASLKNGKSDVGADARMTEASQRLKKIADTYDH